MAQKNANQPIPDELRSDHLFLLVGKNPLPNLVAASLLAKPGATIWLLHSDDPEEGPKGTKRAAEALEIAPMYESNAKKLPVGSVAGLPALVSALIEKNALSYCVLTLGDRGVFAGSGEGEMLYLPTYQVEVADACGSGDAFTAGFLHVLLLGGSLREACRYGNALGSLVASQNGATQSVSPKEIEELMARGEPDRIEPALAAFNAWEK